MQLPALRWAWVSLCLVLGAGMGSSVYAFPDMIRHGYAACVSCHVSPSGGGILTDYGRELSRELLSTWGGEAENKALYGLAALPEPFKIGGDIRAIQTYRDTPSVREGKFFLMQADLEGAYVGEKLAVVASAGWDPGSPDTSSDDAWVSHKHYVMGQLGYNLSLRAGRFQRNYGLMIPDHSSQIRRGLGFDQGTETYNAELNLIEEKFNISLTAVGGRPDDKSVGSEKGFAANAVFFFAQSYKVGVSYFLGKTTADVGRELVGPYWALGLTEKLYWLGEWDLVRIAPVAGGIVEGWVDYNKLGYELMKGLDVYLVQQAQKSDHTKEKIDTQSGGLGVQWSPRPHWIFSGQWQKVSAPARSNTLTDSAYFIFQYYI